ncbi:MAG: hypothetical protein DHS20C18_45280 [Saprospiraceae bacterium]|nr:MAG: hypothetical protein DHS20C18_45280 [Saprospiraceae bacterium]
MKSYFPIFLLLSLCLQGFSQQISNYFEFIEKPELDALTDERWIVPLVHKSLEFDIEQLESALQTLPMRFNESGDYAVLSLPRPDGTTERFAVAEAPVMHEDLGRQYPEIRTFAGQGLDNPASAIYFDITPQGFHAMVLSPEGTYFIDPYFRGKRQYYVCYFKKDYYTDKYLTHKCLVESGEEHPSEDFTPVPIEKNAAVTLRTYRLAMAAAGEYTVFHGGTVALGLAAVVTSVNRINAVYETEVAVRFILVANNNNLIYTNPALDLYSNPPQLFQNQAIIDATIGNGNYDIGHVVSLGNGGVASLGALCDTGVKARGMTALDPPLNDPFDIDYIAHEMGHQMGGDHTFNASNGSCGGNGVSGSAYEPGSGSTIQAYAGICGADNIQFNSHSYFHSRSIDQIQTEITSESCSTNTGTGNNTPTVDADPDNMNGKSIPISTPFELTADGSDPDGNPITYCWEQWNLGNFGSSSSSFLANGPIFRSFAPVSSPTRIFPTMSTLLDNLGSSGEFLPAISRSLTFRCTVRDNQNGGGGSAFDHLSLSVSNSAGPFLVTSQSSSASVQGAITVTWDIANTTSAPVSCANVDILLSVDGGQNFAVLLANTPNDGTQEVTLPDIATGRARIKVKCANNVFFAINDADLQIVPVGASCSDAVFIGDFESGSAGWAEFSTNGFALIANWGLAKSGIQSTWLGGGNNETSRISQVVTIPAASHFATLAYWYRITSFDCAKDIATFNVNGSDLATYSLCGDAGAGGWVRQVIDMSSYIGSSPSIYFEIENDDNAVSNFFVEDVSLISCLGGSFLPVELLHFNAVLKEDDVTLNWATAAELNSAGFEVEMSQARNAFKKIGFVESKGTSGANYTFQVNDLTTGQYYFRLKQVDFDGNSEYTPIESVLVKPEFFVTHFPNPTGEVLYLNVEMKINRQIQVELLNNMGQVIQRIEKGWLTNGVHQLELNVEHLPVGVYHYRVLAGDDIRTGRFMVAH